MGIEGLEGLGENSWPNFSNDNEPASTPRLARAAASHALTSFVAKGKTTAGGKSGEMMPDSQFFGGLAHAHSQATRPNSLAALEIVSTGRAVGAEVRGVDLSQPVPPELAAELREAWLDRLVLLFRGRTKHSPRLLPVFVLDSMATGSRRCGHDL